MSKVSAGVTKVKTPSGGKDLFCIYRSRGVAQAISLIITPWCAAADGLGRGLVAWMGRMMRGVWLALCAFACCQTHDWAVQAQADGSGDCALEDVEEEIRCVRQPHLEGVSELRGEGLAVGAIRTRGGRVGSALHLG